jgi:hypothetical protein
MEQLSLKTIAKDVLFYFLADEIKTQAHDEISHSELRPEYAKTISLIYLKDNLTNKGVQFLLDDYFIRIESYIDVAFLKSIEDIMNGSGSCKGESLTLSKLYKKDSELTLKLILFIIGEPIPKETLLKIKERLFPMDMNLPVEKIKYNYQPVWSLVSKISEKIEKLDCVKLSLCVA